MNLADTFGVEMGRFLFGSLGGIIVIVVVLVLVITTGTKHRRGGK